ncbi:MAG: formate dehydrogenase accessory sulfurtransferase FdhD [Candidatus Bipolaricaulaceae bacterium]
MRRLRIRRFREQGWEEVWDEIAEEGLLELNVKDGPTVSLVCTPQDIKALVFGYLLGRGLIRAAEEVQEYREEWDFSVAIPGEVVRVAVRLAREISSSTDTLIWSSCAGEANFAGCEVLSPRPLFSASNLLSIPQKINAHIQGFRRTGAFHYAFLLDRDMTILTAGEDIGRHNAVDKAIGKAVLTGQGLEETVLFTTGRATAEMAAKAVRAGIPLLASQGAALLGAIHLARKCNLGLIGFLRGRRFNLYAGEAWLKP